jgi:hypothetical protein
MNFLLKKRGFYYKTLVEHCRHLVVCPNLISGGISLAHGCFLLATLLQLGPVSGLDGNLSSIGWVGSLINLAGLILLGSWRCACQVGPTWAC